MTRRERVRDRGKQYSNGDIHKLLQNYLSAYYKLVETQPQLGKVKVLSGYCIRA